MSRRGGNDACAPLGKQATRSALWGPAGVGRGCVAGQPGRVLPAPALLVQGRAICARPRTGGAGRPSPPGPHQQDKSRPRDPNCHEPPSWRLTRWLTPSLWPLDRTTTTTHIKSASRPCGTGKPTLDMRRADLGWQLSGGWGKNGDKMLHISPHRRRRMIAIAYVLIVTALAVLVAVAEHPSFAANAGMMLHSVCSSTCPTT